MNKDKAIKYLKEVKEVFDENQIPFWLIYGTLIGAVRDKNIIPWDNDIDLGAPSHYFTEDIKKKLTKALERKHYFIYFFDNEAMYVDKDDISIGVEIFSFDKNKRLTIRKRCKKNNKISFFLFKFNKLISVLNYGSIRLDLSRGIKYLMKINFFKIIHFIPFNIRYIINKPINFILSPLNKTAWYYVETPTKCLTEFKEIDFCTIKIKIPKYYDEFLQEEYGNWKIPKRVPENEIVYPWWKDGKWKPLKS